MTNKRRPVVLDQRHPAAAPPVSSGGAKAVQTYKDAVAQRAAQQRAAREPMPNIAQAQELYKPGKERPMSIGAIGEAQRRMDTQSNGGGGLRPETVAGLTALHGAMQEQRSKMSEEQGSGLPQLPQMAAPAPAAPPPVEKTESKDKPVAADDPRKSKLRDTLSEMDDLEFDRVLRSVQHDAINNDKERRAIKERVKPIDLLRGISTGVFEQDVPIIPGALVVRYRTISALENQSIRLLLFKMIDQDKRRENIAAELYGLMQAVCSVVMINNTAQSPHLKGEGYKAEFDESGFILKFNQYIRYPLVMLHAIGTHGYWFEQRVRDAFSTDAIKNG